MLNKDSPVPLYIQFKEYLLDQIESGELKLSQRLPSEREFCDQFGISRITVRQALNELMRDGLIQSVPGKGTFVASKREEEFHPLTSFSQHMHTRGQSPASEILNQAVIRSSPRLARQMQLAVDAEVALIDRLRFVDGKPRALQTAYLPLVLCPDILKHDLVDGSLYKTLHDRYGLVPIRADNSFEARLAEPKEEDLLRLPHPAAVLVMRQTCYLKNNRPVEYTRSIYRANERFHSFYGPLISGEEDL
jgi:GntR family transcriptional regulator